MKLIMQFFPVSFYLLCLSPKYLSQHRNLEHPQSPFFQRQAKFHTH